MPTLTFRGLYGLIFVAHNRPKIRHFNVSQFPSFEFSKFRAATGLAIIFDSNRHLRKGCQ